MAVIDSDICLAIPTYRSRDIAKTVSVYAQNFAHFGHQVPIVVFDDSSTQDARVSEGSLRVVAKSFPGQRIFYVGPHEKRGAMDKLERRFSDANGVVSRLFRPSYGGNRNWVLAYTMGSQFVSVDDDMRPYGLFVNGESAESGVVSQGTFLFESEMGGVQEVQQDVMSGYKRLLGTRVDSYGSTIRKGRDVEDSSTDHLNRTVGGLEQSVVRLVDEGNVNGSALIQVVQSHLTGDADIDSADLVELFLQTGVDDILSGKLPKKFALSAHAEAITSDNRRMTGAVLGYDNRQGAIYFLPTDLRCEDFVWRMYLASRNDVANAYTGQVQTHTRSLSVRNSIARDWYNELVANLMKEKLLAAMNVAGKNTMTFHDGVVVSAGEARGIEDVVRKVHADATKKATTGASGDVGSYLAFAGELDSILGDDIGDSERFPSRLTTMLQREIRLFNDVAEIWPSVLEFTHDVGTGLPIVDITRESRK